MAHLNVVLFGGTFNPIHNGHIAIAQTLLSKQEVDEVWFVLANQAPLKDVPHVKFEHRFAMIARAIENIEGCKVCDIEKDLPVPSYTIDTIKALQQSYSHHFSWVIGSDQAKQIEKWKSYNELLAMIPFYVILRNDEPWKDSRFLQIHALSKASSTAIRTGKSNDTPSAVLQYMIMNHLYDFTIVSSHMSTYRYNHSVSVCETALTLSKNVSVKQDEVVVASMYHDIAKEWNHEKSAYWLALENISIGLLKPYEIHAYAAMAYLKNYYDITNTNILDAIAHHVTGTSNNTLAKILYVADKIEPTRDYEVASLMAIAMQDIDVAFEQIKQNNLSYNQSKGGMQ